MVDREFGTGCVKITPAHDFNDFEVGKRHNLEPIPIFTLTATVNDNAPEKYRGLDRYVARKRVLEDLRAAGLVVSEKPHRMMVPRCGRTGEVVEPTLSEQWYMAMSKPAPAGTLHPGQSIAQVALEAVARGDVKIFPEQWLTVYNQWLENIQDWCISRQLWWGHQIPAWYDERGNVFVARNEAEAQAKAQAAGSTGAADARPGRARHLVLVRAWCRSPRSAGRTRRARTRSPTTSTCRRPCSSPATTSSSSGSPG